MDDKNYTEEMNMNLAIDKFANILLLICLLSVSFISGQIYGILEVAEYLDENCITCEFKEPLK